jgi:hypothetical protein
MFALATALLSGCGTPGVPLPPSLELAKPVTDLRAVRKGDKVYLAWTVPSETTDRQTVRHLGSTRICRSFDPTMATCGTLVGEVPPPKPPVPSQAKPGNTPPKPQASYTDTLPRDLQEKNPTALLTYAISVMNTNGRSAGFSNRVQVPAAPTLPPPTDFKAQLTSGGVVLSWTAIAEPQAGELHHAYRTYRRPEGSTTETEAGMAPLGTSSLVDQSFEWEGTYYYRATVVAIIPQAGRPDLQVEGDDTPVVKVVAHDVFPPAVPSGLQAVASGVGQPLFIDLIWAPDTDADLAGYNIYRHEEGQQPAKINPQPVTTPAFRDTNVASGKTYLYSVSAVDLRGNESARSEETSEAAP